MAKKTCSKDLTRLVLDVLKPHSPTLPEFATKLSALPGVAGVNITVMEIDRDTETVKVTIEGMLDYSAVRSAIEEFGGVVHSVDEVMAGCVSVGEAHVGETRKTTSKRK